MTTAIRSRAAAITLLIHGVLVLLLLYFVITTPVPPLGGGEGVLVNIGYVDVATGEEQPLSENVTEEPNLVKETPPPVTQETEVATQDLEDAPVIEQKKKKPEIKKSPVVVKETPVKKTETTPKPVERTVDQRAMYKGKTTNSTSQGTAISGSGDQGNPLGDPNSNQYGKPGSGNGTGDGFGTGPGSGNGNGPGISYDLKGRTPVRLPRVVDNSKEEGKVVIDVVVDKNGKVVSATGPARGSTTTSSYLVKKARDAAFQTVFSGSKEGVEEQRGTISFRFINK